MDMVKDVLKLGVPTAIGNSFWNLFSALSTFILTYGEKFYAAYQIGLQAEGFCDMMASGFLTASMALASQAIGANDEKMYQSAYQRLSFYCLIISGISSYDILAFVLKTGFVFVDGQKRNWLLLHMYIYC